MAVAAAAPSSPGPDEGSALLFAAESGAVASLQRWVSRGGDLNAPLPSGWTPLQLAAYHGHATAVRTLLEAGARGAKAAHIAARQGHVAALEALLEFGIDPDAPDEVRLPAARRCTLRYRLTLMPPARPARTFAVRADGPALCRRLRPRAGCPAAAAVRRLACSGGGQRANSMRPGPGGWLSRCGGVVDAAIHDYSVRPTATTPAGSHAPLGDATTVLGITAPRL